MKLKKNERRLLALTVIAVGIVAVFLFVPTNAAASWNANYSGNGLRLHLQGRTELLGAGGAPIQLRFLAKMAMLPLSFVYQGQTVEGLRVSFDYGVEGENVNWNTLVVTAVASGTGGFYQRATFTTQSGSHSFTLPITVAQLGREPSDNETVYWSLTISLSAEARSLQGTPMSAESQPITSTVKTVWAEDNFQPETSPSTEIPNETGNPTNVGGGCGPHGHHLVWVGGVEAVPFWQEFGWQLTVTTVAFASLGCVAYVLEKRFSQKSG